MDSQPEAAPREHWLAVEFSEMVANCKTDGSSVSLWLEEVKNGLAVIFGLDPQIAWETNAFVAAMNVMLKTVKCLAKEGHLPTVSPKIYRRASAEWQSQDAGAHEMREFVFAMNASLRGPVELFEPLLDGMLAENKDVRAYCHRSLAKLFRMIRLERQSQGE